MLAICTRYDSAEPHLIGYDAFVESADQRSTPLNTMSGPGFAISQALARELVLVLPGCLHMQKQHVGSDQKLYKCIAGKTTSTERKRHPSRNLPEHCKSTDTRVEADVCALG